MIFCDFETFRYDWLGVFIDPINRIEKVIENDVDALNKLYEQYKSDIWVGYNIRHYDQYIMKGILCGFDPWEINKHIIIDDKPGWSFSRMLGRIQMVIYDVMPNPPIGLKTLECFMGSNVKETDVSFDLNRKLTREEIEQTIEYCRHDVEETIRVFCKTKDVFDAQLGIVNAFQLPMKELGSTEARITAKVLGCESKQFDDEFDYFILPCVQLKKYRYVQDWFLQIRDDFKWDLEFAKDPSCHGANIDVLKKDFYKKKFETVIAGIPHTFGFGGVHGASDKPVHETGLILHVDVNNYYPSLLIAWGLVTRAATNDNYKLVYDTRWELKQKQMSAETKEEAKKYKKAQLPYKKLLNALSGAMKDKTNQAYDPRNNNCMCINGQLMLLDLIEHLEVVPGFVLVQANTDGLIIKIEDSDEAFDMADDICRDWENRCSTARCNVGLAFDYIDPEFGIYQKDVNNYIMKFDNGEIERKGAYVKSLNDLDYDLPIVNEAMVKYICDGTPVRETIYGCDDLRKFQKVVKLSDKYDHVELEKDGGRIRYTYKCYRVFASKNEGHGRLLKVRSNGKVAKFGNTSDHCFIHNDEITENTVIPSYLNREWYVDMTEKRLKEFGAI